MQGYKAGADNYLTKPFDREDLLTKMNAHNKCQQQRSTLEANVNEAKKTAYTAMMSDGKLGQVMKFIEKSADIYDYHKLAEILIEFVNKLQHKCFLVFSTANSDFFFLSTRTLKPHEAELIIILRQKKRFDN